MIPILDESDVRRIVREMLARPCFVNQRTSQTVIGLPGRDFLSAAHAGHFPWTKERRLIIARTADVLAWLERRIVHHEAKPANDADSESTAFARVGARRIAS